MTRLRTNWDDFYWLTGEFPPTFDILITEIIGLNNRRQGPHNILTVNNQVAFCILYIPYLFLFNVWPRTLHTEIWLSLLLQVLLTLIWLQKYLPMCVLENQFRIHVSVVHRTIHNMIPLLHVSLVNKYVTWPTLAKWRALAGYFPDWPRVVAIMDCTPFRISKPKGLKYSTLAKLFVHNSRGRETINFGTVNMNFSLFKSFQVVFKDCFGDKIDIVSF